MAAKLKPFILGVDPGITGAICAVMPPTSTPIPHHVLDLPLTPNRKPSRLDAESLKQALASFPFCAPHLEPSRTHSVSKPSTLPLPSLVVIERSQVLSGRESRASMFNYGTNYGILLAVLHNLYSAERCIEVSAAAWKADLNVPRDKNQAMARATEIFGTNQNWKLKKHHGRAEAALLAYFGWKHFGQLNLESQ